MDDEIVKDQDGKEMVIDDSGATTLQQYTSLYRKFREEREHRSKKLVELR